jgi:hypothetical protein
MKKQSILLLLCFYFSSSHAIFKNFNSFDTKDLRMRNFVAGLLTGAGINLAVFRNEDLNKYLDTFAIGLGGMIFINIDNTNENSKKTVAISHENQSLLTRITEWYQQHSKGFSIAFYYAAGLTTGIALSDTLQKNIRDAWNGLRNVNQRRQGQIGA